MRAALGGLLVAAHALAFVAIVAPGARRCGTELAVDVTGPPASPTLALDGALPGALAGRVAIDDAGAGPGLHRRRWTVRYRGGVERSVGAVQLVGPFQDPRAPACVGRVVVGQRLLDDGHAGSGTVAAAMAAQLRDELGGEDVFPVGALERIDHLALRWARLDAHPGDRALVGDAPHGYVRATATVVFERVAVPLTVALIPEPSPAALRFRVAARAELAFESRAVQWISDRIGADRLATRLARRQIDDALVTALAPPPPVTLSGGQTLRFSYCDGPPEIAEGAFGALPFGVAISPSDRDPRILPPRRGPGAPLVRAPDSALALDLDLDALNALLYELWRGGTLDRRLADAGLDRRFNADPRVTELLTLRLAPPRLTLPPVVTASPGGLRLSAEARVAIHDGAATTTGRVWGSLEFRFAAHAIEPIGVDLGALELSCERSATTLVPCYGDLVAALRGRAAEFHGVLTQTFIQLVSDVFVGRIGASGATGLPVELVIRSASPSLHATTDNASLHVELDAALARPP
ncbi:MAG TPA: hypothetical protein VFK02_12775 [Kofleriaceae bacterium]|nr:hypothetical protein [Kofleriaceae bacterium]